MKAWLIYWLIGCFIVGGGLAAGMRKCPSDPLELEKALVVVAIWPALVLAMINTPKLPEMPCRVASLSK